MKEVRIEKTANMITEAFKKASEDAKKTVDALMTDDAKKKLDVLESLEANEKNDDLRDEKSETVKVPTPHEKAAEKLKQAARELYKEHSDIEILRAELKDARHDLNSAYREIENLRLTISKMKYAHDEEVRALEDDLAEAKILGKKAGEYTSMLDADSDTFETILELAKVIHGLAKNAESVSLLIKDEVEGHI